MSPTWKFGSNRRLAFLATLAPLIPLSVCQWTRFPSMTVLGQHLYIQGGESTQQSSWVPENKTRVVPLNTAWTARTVIIEEFENSGYEPTNWITMWPDTGGTKLYAWGGAATGIVGAWTRQPRLRSFKPDTAGSARGTWSAAPDRPAARGSSQSIYRTSIGSWTSCNGLGFHLGGLATNRTDSTFPFGLVGDPALPGLLVYNMTDGTWINQTAEGFGSSPQGTHLGGTAVCLPTLGTRGEGIVVFLGGYQPDLTSEPRGERYISMNKISFYDIGSGSFHSQTTDGDNIPPRKSPCAVVGKSPDTKAYEIFFYGGANTSPAHVHVLTVPGFRWFWPASSSSPSSPGRGDHACAVAPGPGGRQMIAFGGTDSYNIGDPLGTEDRWVKGLQVLDMTELKWSDQYDPAAKPYQQPQMVRDWHTTSNLKAVKWDNPATRELFADIIENPNTNNGNATSPPAPPTPPPPARSGSPVAAIAGGVVGGVVAWVLAASLLGYFCWYKPRKQRELQRQQQQSLGYSSLKADRRSLLATHELPQQGITPELPHGRLAHELPQTHVTHELPAEPSQ